MAGPRVVIVSSTRSLRPAWRGLRSVVTSTSTRMAFWSSFSILASLAVACLRNLSSTSVCRPLKTMSILWNPFRSVDRSGTRPADLVFYPTSAC